MLKKFRHLAIKIIAAGLATIDCCIQVINFCQKKLLKKILQKSFSDDDDKENWYLPFNGTGADILLILLTTFPDPFPDSSVKPQLYRVSQKTVNHH